MLQILGTIASKIPRQIKLLTIAVCAGTIYWSCNGRHNAVSGNNNYTPFISRISRVSGVYEHLQHASTVQLGARGDNSDKPIRQIPHRNSRCYNTPDDIYGFTCRPGIGYSYSQGFSMDARLLYYGPYGLGLGVYPSDLSGYIFASRRIRQSGILSNTYGYVSYTTKREIGVGLRIEL